MSELADRNTEKYERWLNLISDLADKAEFRNVSAALSHLTAAGTVLEDPQVVYVSEFLEWLTNNLRPALVSKKGRPERDEAAKIVKEALAAAIGALREPDNQKKMHDAFAAVRYRATRLQLSKLSEEMEMRLSPSQMLLHMGEGNDE